MQIGEAFVSGWGVFLPNDPVTNEEIDDVLGPGTGVSAAVKRRILVNNGISTRHYAIDRYTGQPTHTNAQMAAEAVRALVKRTPFPLEEIDCLVCGTSAGDQIFPSHGSMVHAELGCPACEVATTAGVCCASMAALKYGYLSVASGASQNAVVTGSDLASVSLTSRHFRPELDLKSADVEAKPMLAFENDFLRWMLSDGAGAALVTPVPRSTGLSLKIDWLDILSYAHESEVCMYYGMQKKPDGSSASYRAVADPVELCKGRFLNLAQDVGVLQERLPALLRKATRRVKEKRQLAADSIDWFLPHYSSKWFRKPLYEGCVTEGILPIPEERWFSNLSTKGNTGSASILIMLEELVASGKLRSGQTLLCLVPESARMTFAFLHLTVA
jgi:3-oxoacyl-[acyl-carrier-protein] synthase-3